MIVSINQPAYLPWLGYFDRIDYADKHIVLDHVQFEKNSFTNRNKILSKDCSIWLTIPLQTKGKFGDLAICDINIDNRNNWTKKHLSSIQQNYTKTAFFDQYFPEIKNVYQEKWDNLIDIIEKLNNLFLLWLGIETEIVYSNTLNIKSKKSDLVLDLCKHEEASIYISGKLGKGYLEQNKFKENQINIKYQDYKHPVYSQKFKGFTPYMSILDLLFNHGDNSLEIIRQGRNFIK